MSWRGHIAGLTAAAGLGVFAVVPAAAQSLPANDFQTYNAASAGSIVPGPFALFAVPVDQLQPTQMNEGFTEVNSKANGFDILTPSQLQATLLGDIEPVVIGPGGVLYLTDGHHTFTALEDSSYGSTDPTVYVNVIANYSNLTMAQFWEQMQASDLLLPLNDGVPQIVNLSNGSPIPTSLTGLTEDPYRGLEYSILKNKNSKLFPNSSNIAGVTGSSTPGLDKITGLYGDFIWADAYRNANGGLGLPYLSPGDIQLSTQWNLNGNSVTSEPNIGTVTVAQLPGYILPNNDNIVISSTISNATLSTGTLDGNGTFTGITQFNLGTPSNPILVGTPQSGFVMQLGNDLGGTVTLSGNNTYTGGTTIIAGNLIIASDAALGASPPESNAAFNASLTLNSAGFPTNVLTAVEADNGIIFNSLTEGNGTLTIGTTAGGGTQTFTTNRPIAVDSEAATINVNGYVVTLGGPLVSAGTADVALGNADGEAALTIDDNSANLGKLILSTPSPEFYGNIIIGNNNNPTVAVMNDAALGNTTLPASEIGQVELNGGTLQTGASFSAPERDIFLGGGSQIDVDGNTTTWGTLTDVKRTIAIGNSNTTTPGSITFNNFNIAETATLQLDGSANGVTYTGAETVTFTNGIVRTGNATLFIDPSSGTSLGSSQTVFSSGASTVLTGSTAAAGNPGIAPAWLITDNEATGGANANDFVTYSAGTGYVAATYKTALDSGSTGNDVVELASSTPVAGPQSAYALKLENEVTVSITSGTLTIGDGTDPAGLILSGSSSHNSEITGGTLAFGGSEAIIYTRSTEVNGSVIGSLISSAITGSGGLTLAGAGALTLSTAQPGLSGAITIDSGELNLTAANVFATDVAGLTLDDVKSHPAKSLLNFTASQAFSTLNSADSGTDSEVTFSNGAALTIGDSNNLDSTLYSTIKETGTAVTGTLGGAVGAINKNGTGLLDISGSAGVTLVSGSNVLVNAGALRIGNGVFSSSATNPILVASGAELQYSGNGGSVFNDPIQGAGVFHLLSGTVQLTGANSYSGGTVLELGTTLDVTTANLPTDAVISNAGGTLLFDQSSNGTFTGVMSDGKQSGGPNDPNDMSCTLVTCSGPNLSGTLIKDDSTYGNSGNVTIANVQGYTGMTYVEAGTLTLGAVNTIATSEGVVLGRVGGAVCNPAPCSGATAILALGANNTIAGLADDPANTTEVQLNGYTLTLAPIAGSSWSYAGSIIDNGTSGGGLVQNGPGTSVLTGTNTYTGATTIDAGILEVDGSITSSSSVSVNSGGVLDGDGTVDPPAVTIASGGTFAPGSPGVPGTFMTIAGNLAFQSGAFYLVQLNSTTSTYANVTGTAALAGTVLADFQSGANPQRQYIILQSAGLGGTTFAGVATNLVNFDATLSYTSYDVLLNIGAALGAGAGLNTNQQNVANGLNNFFNNGGTLPANFLNVFGLTGSGLGNALSQLDGEVATGAETGAFQLMDQFLNLMLDPFVNGRGNAPGTSGGAIGFAPDEQASLPPQIAQAYAEVLKAPAPASFDQRWSAWGTAYGGSSTAQGNGAVGSNTINASTYGVAGGMDYRVSPYTILGFALAGGGTGWGLANSLGTGYSQALQVGGYGISWFGPAYVSGALAFTNNWFTTNRSALGDQLTANFAGQSYGARVEGGYRFTPFLRSPASGGELGWGTLGVTPYAALQAQDFSTPNYSETDKTGGGFGLSYAAMNATDVRTELGTRFDNPTLFYDKPLILFGRLAWAHDFVSNPSLSAAFETLPGSSFTIFGTPIPHDSALTTAGLQYFFTANWQLIAKFEGDFAGGYQLYAGTGTLRYTW